MQCLQLVSRSSAIAAASSSSALATAVAARRTFATTPQRMGLEQLIDTPTSSTRIPTGLHAGPNKRVANVGEVEGYKFVKKWELQMQESWDSNESFKGQPKPKKQFGNEACEVIWPYALLLENTINIHRFTKSIYVYYPQRQETADGKFAAAVAKRFSQQYLVPITFHNSQCYVETEMLVEYGEVPWVVIHCLDGRHAILPLKCTAPSSSGNAAASSSSSSSAAEKKDDVEGSSSSAAASSSTSRDASSFSPLDVKTAAEDFMNDVIAKADELGNSVKDVNATLIALHDRPLQNQFVRVNYQWYGDSQEDRSSHLVQWNFDPSKVLPATKHKDSEVRARLNFDGRFPNALEVNRAAHSDKRRIVKSGDGSGLAGIRSGAAKRQNARYSPSAGSNQRF